MNFEVFTDKVRIFMKGQVSDNSKRFSLLQDILKLAKSDRIDLFWSVLEKGDFFLTPKSQTDI